MRRLFSAALGAVVLVLPHAAQAQRPLAERIKAMGTKTVAFNARSRPETCGDGLTSYSDGLTSSQTRYFIGYDMISYGSWEGRTSGPCEKGPVRVTVRVVEGQLSWLHTYVGPLTTLGDTITDLGAVSTSDARTFLEPLVLASDGRASLESMMPFVMIDSLPRWSVFERVARDSSRMSKYRRRAADLMARGAAATVPAEPGVDEDIRSTRREAVYALARQQPTSDNIVTDLLTIATSNPHRDARVAALYQLGQGSDPRSVELFATMLRGKP